MGSLTSFFILVLINIYSLLNSSILNLNMFLHLLSPYRPEFNQVINYTILFISNTFLSNTSLKLAKNQAKDKQKHEAELLLFENYTLSSPMLSSKINKRYSVNVQKTRLCLFQWDHVINHNENKAENEKWIT